MTSRLVYSSDKGRVCPSCGWPTDDCRCARHLNATVPARVIAKLRLESKGRGGRIVTVVDGLPDNTPFLDDLVKALKKACATRRQILSGRRLLRPGVDGWRDVAASGPGRETLATGRPRRTSRSASNRSACSNHAFISAGASSG